MSHQKCDEALEQAWNRIEELEKENEFLKAQIAHWDVVLALRKEHAESTSAAVAVFSHESRKEITDVE